MKAEEIEAGQAADLLGAAGVSAGAIHGQMAEIMRRIEPIKKERTAGSGSYSYKFRGVYDVYSAVHDIMAEVGVYMTSAVRESKFAERESAKGGWLGHRIMVIEWAFRSTVDGSFVTTEVPTEGIDNSDKASFKGISASQKYAVITTFLIPDEQAAAEPEADNYRPVAKQQARSQPAASEEAVGLVTTYNTLLHEALQKGVFGTRENQKEARAKAKSHYERAVKILQSGGNVTALTNLVVEMEKKIQDADQTQAAAEPDPPEGATEPEFDDDIPWEDGKSSD